MPKYKDIELLSIGKARVYLPPNMKIHLMVEKRFPLPSQPIMEIELATAKNSPPESEPLLIAEGPKFDAWEAECKSVQEAMRLEEDAQFYLYALRDVKVPGKFDMEAEYGDMIRYEDEYWQPRPGKIGRKIDYLEWYVMGYSDDAVAVSNALNELMGISQEVVDDVKSTFPGDVEEPAAGDVDRG